MLFFSNQLFHQVILFSMISAPCFAASSSSGPPAYAQEQKDIVVSCMDKNGLINVSILGNVLEIIFTPSTTADQLIVKSIHARFRELSIMDKDISEVMNRYIYAYLTSIDPKPIKKENQYEGSYEDSINDFMRELTESCGIPWAKAKINSKEAREYDIYKHITDFIQQVIADRTSHIPREIEAAYQRRINELMSEGGLARFSDPIKCRAKIEKYIRKSCRSEEDNTPIVPPPRSFSTSPTLCAAAAARHPIHNDKAPLTSIKGLSEIHPVLSAPDMQLLWQPASRNKTKLAQPRSRTYKKSARRLYKKSKPIRQPSQEKLYHTAKAHHTCKIKQQRM